MSDDLIKRHRAKIDAIDARIIRLLNQRAKLALQIGKAKRKGRQEAYAPDREQQVLKNLTKAHSGPFPEQVLRNIYQEVISACRALQSPMLVAYLGPEATFTHSATLKHFGQSMRMVPEMTINSVFEAVESAEADYGVVPIENSTEGVVTSTMDRLIESPLQICGEILLPVSHYLLGRKKGITPEQIYSHPQAMAQCRAWLERHYPNVPLTPVESTGQAAQLAGEDGKAYAIGSELAASHYNLKIIHPKIEDHHNNMTRFLVLGTKGPKRSGQDKTSLVFAVKDEPGILYKMLEPFEAAGINLSKIESRPMVRLNPSKAKARRNQGRWEYAFFIDLDGHIQSRKVKQAVEQLEKKCQFLKVLGSYPRGK